MTRNVVIGTAGHIDHGKTALVMALTGTDTDRLAEEKRRGITIDLGFARLDLPGDIRAGVVDVPGHEDFIRNMVAGAAGIDVALLVVAADEGVMPQTREHVSILGMLGVERAVVALTKTDLVDDDWLELSRDDVRMHLAETPYAAAPVVPVSARTRDGLPELAAALADAVGGATVRPDSELFRLPVDRAFTVHGTGTVVTGTIRDGSVAVGDEVRVHPDGPAVRGRGIQCHGDSVDGAAAGTRTALALAGLERARIGRGGWVVSDGWPLSSMLTVRLQLVPGTDWQVRQRQRVRVHIGTAECMARVVLLDADRIGPGEAGLAQLRMEAPVVARFGDRFVVRSYSPVTTIGGGVVLEPAAAKRRRLQPRDQALFRTLQAAPGDALAPLVDAAGWDGVPVPELPLRLGLAATAQMASIPAVTRAGDRLISTALLDSAEAALLTATAEWHRLHPLRPGLDRAEARRRLPASPDWAIDVVIDRALASGRLESRDGDLALPGHQPTLDAAQEAARDRLVALYAEAALAPPSLGELPAELAQRPDFHDLRAILERDGVLVPFPPDRLVHAPALERARSRLLAELGGRADLGPADFRRLFDLPRKHLIPLLELFDRMGWTRREGDGRVVPAPEHAKPADGRSVPRTA